MQFLFASLLLATFVGANTLLPAVSSATVAPSHLLIWHRNEMQPGQQTEITEKNWQQHPRIKAVRRLVRSIDAGLKKGAYKTTERRFEYCDDQHFTIRRIARDGKGIATWYRDYAEGEDASWDFYYYYDHAGRLRFVFAIARGANDTREQLRIYFDETGKRLWKDDKLLKGLGCPGCFSAYADSDAGLAFDPAKAFANDQGCKEIKPKRTNR